MRLPLAKLDRWASIGALIFVLFVILYLISIQVNKYAPLEHPLPENVTRNPAVFHLSEADGIVSRSLFINSDSVPLTSDVSAQWVLIEPRPSTGLNFDSVIAEILFTTSFEPGCQVGKFENIIPADVKRVTEAAFADGFETVTWRLEGTNTIVAPRRAPDVVPFYLEDITFIPDNQPLPEFVIEETPSCP